MIARMINVKSHFTLCAILGPSDYAVRKCMKIVLGLSMAQPLASPAETVWAGGAASRVLEISFKETPRDTSDVTLVFVRDWANAWRGGHCGLPSRGGCVCNPSCGAVTLKTRVPSMSSCGCLGRQCYRTSEVNGQRQNIASRRKDGGDRLGIGLIWERLCRLNRGVADAVPNVLDAKLHRVLSVL